MRSPTVLSSAVPGRVVAALVFCLLVPSAAGARDDGEKKDERYTRMEKGEVIVKAMKVKGSLTKKVRSVAIVQAPPAALWKLIERCDDYETTMLHIAKAEELSRKGGNVRCRVTVDMPFPLEDITATTDIVHTVIPGKKWHRQWKLVSGDYKFNSGSWTLTPYAGGRHTLVVYDVHAEPKVAVPEMIQRMAQKKSVPALFEHLRKQLQK